MILTYGSRLYGLTTPYSDCDTICIAEENKNSSYMYSTFEDFAKALNEDQNLACIEVYFSNVELLNKHNVYYVYNADRFRRTISSIVSNSYVKAKKKIRQGDFYIGLKSFWHSYRILYKALELAEYGEYDPVCVEDKNLADVWYTIMEFQCDIETEEDQIFNKLKELFDADLKSMQTKFRTLCPLDY